MVKYLAGIKLTSQGFAMVKEYYGKVSCWNKTNFTGICHGKGILW